MSPKTFLSAGAVLLLIAGQVQAQTLSSDRSALRDFGQILSQAQLQAGIASAGDPFRSAQMRLGRLALRLEELAANPRCLPGGRYEAEFDLLQGHCATLGALAGRYARSLETMNRVMRHGATYGEDAVLVLQNAQLVSLQLNLAMKQVEKRVYLLAAKCTPGDGFVTISPRGIWRH